MRRALAVALSLAMIGVGGAMLQPAAPAEAVTGSQFVAGNIISDNLFYDSAAMSQAQIQSFLNQKVGSCSNGACLNVLVTTVASRAQVGSGNTLRCLAFQGGKLSAAAIIYRVQVACSISAKVILVTLEKEQGLVDKRAPAQSALDRAMGYACPDTAPCAPTTLGFGNQVYSAALQFQTYKVNHFGMQPGVNVVRLNPNAACGSTSVNIKNYATAALYNYTPYQPNAAALRNLHGTGDGCSSYGNRNFWVYYSDWFGPTDGGGNASANPVTAEPASYVMARDSHGDLWLYPENGKGAWLTPGQVGDGWNSATALFGAGDFSGDGYPDMIARDAAGALWMYPRDGAGGWLPRVMIGSGWGPMSLVFGAGDFNGDGHPDVFARDSSGGLWLYSGNGKGGWLGQARIGSGWGPMVSIFGAGDFNGDGHQDVFARDAAGTLWLYPGNGKGSWLAATKVSTGWASFTGVYGAGDFNGDGHQDVFARDAAGTLWLYPGNGKGGLLARSAAGTGWQSMTALFAVGDLGGAPIVPPADGSTAAHDFSGDGHPDVLARNAAGALLLYRGTGAGTWSTPTQVGAGWTPFTSIFAAGDFNSDGHPDVLARDASGVLWLYPGDGKGSWLRRVQVGQGWGPFTSIFGVGDFNSDGHPDVLARNAAGVLWLYPGNGKGSWLAPVTIGKGWGAFNSLTGVGDFNGDWNADVLARDASGVLWLYPGNGAGGWLAPTTVGRGWDSFKAIVGAGDFNGDGKPDVITMNAASAAWLYPGNGKGSWAASTSIASNMAGYQLVG